ncbi:MAG TPA: hypothetical protein VG097_21215, partial [Gemmata sp.]|nr:hypothetical protein [Gemmata sp.]
TRKKCSTRIVRSNSKPPNKAVEDIPIADFYTPPGFGWTTEGYEVRAALKRYSEATHADS